MTPAPRASLAALGLLLPLLKPYLPRVFAAIAALLLAAGLTLALGQGLKHLIDDGFAGGPGALDSAALVMGALITALAAATTTIFYDNRLTQGCRHLGREQPAKHVSSTARRIIYNKGYLFAGPNILCKRTQWRDAKCNNCKRNHFHRSEHESISS